MKENPQMCDKDKSCVTVTFLGDKFWDYMEIQYAYMSIN